MLKKTPSIYVKQIPVGPMMNFAYLIGAKRGNDAVLIDPSWDAKKLIHTAKDEKRKIVALLATHTHFDHVNALEDVANKLRVPVYVHEMEKNNIPNKLDIHTTKDGSTIEEAGLKIKCLHTPGHTPGSQCFLAEDTLFTGDTMFIGGCGRVDLEGGNPEQMVNSLVRLGSLSGNIIVYPGHDYGNAPLSTIEEQRRTNPYMNERAETLM